MTTLTFALLSMGMLQNTAVVLGMLYIFHKTFNGHGGPDGPA